MLRSIKITIFFILICNIAVGQINHPRYGGKIGLLYELGSPVHRLGITVGLRFNKSAVQLTSNHAFFYAFRNYGPSIARWEVQSDVNLGIAFGPKHEYRENISILSPTSNFSEQKNIISYGLKYYYDKIETQQLCGNIGIRLGNYFLLTQNDGFAFLPFDQYRTGAISLGGYFNNSDQFTERLQHRVSIDVLLYTGKTQGEPTQKITETNYPSRFGYKKLNDSKYASSSHGILRFSWQAGGLNMQNASAYIGVDNEHIRNVVQNKFIHDLPFLPASIIKIKNPHIPMRNSDGGDYLYQENDRVRKGKFVWGVGINRPFFY